jgi:hypothetical protein
MNSERPRGFHIDLPRPDSQIGAHKIDIEGWVLGRSSSAVAVEVVHKGAVVQRVPIDVFRPHAAAAHPEVPEAENSGFRTTVSVPDWPNQSCWYGRCSRIRAVSI